MKKHALIVLVLLLLALGLASPSAADGPPWKPELVHKEEGMCGMWWVNASMEQYWVWGVLTEVYQPKTGVRNGTCQLYLDFDDSNVLSIAEVCNLLGNPPDCRGNGAIVSKGWACGGPNGEITYLSQSVISPSGSWKSSCHFRAE
jgi:hypothetical protein